MHAMTDQRAGRPHSHLLRFAIIVACAVVGLAVGISVRADTPQGRRPGEPLVEARRLSAGDRSETRGRVEAVARGLGIPGRVAAPRRVYHALDLRVVDETAITDRRGRTVAIIRTDGETGALRSVVRLDWSADAVRPRVDRSAAVGNARREARLAGLGTPAAKPLVRWDEAMGAWRVDWHRRVDGRLAIGDGLTIWIQRGGQLAALLHAETPTAAAPPRQVGPDAAAAATREWAERHGVPAKGLALVVAADLVWVRPNDFLVRGGADDTDPLLHLAYRVDLTIPMAGSAIHRIAVFVDVGSGALIAGIETA